jgi:gamma-glutamylcyclotransferase (GGCT)/AIG2-like uncharacterized protein YtfP
MERLAGGRTPALSTLPSNETEGTEADYMSTTDSTDSAEASPESACRLAVYGTLAPGRANHHQLTGLSGRWIEGTVRGQLHEAGWGAYLGYPAIVLDADGPEVSVQLFESSDLPEHWDRLDTFEGPAYRRAVTTVRTVEGDLLASIYELAPA